VYSNFINDRADSLTESTRICNSLNFYGLAIFVHNRLLSIWLLGLGFGWFGLLKRVLLMCDTPWVGFLFCFFEQVHFKPIFGQAAPLFCVGILSVRLPIGPGGSVSYCNGSTALGLALAERFFCWVSPFFLRPVGKKIARRAPLGILRGASGLFSIQLYPVPFDKG
jgi:hypothetical protein